MRAFYLFIFLTTAAFARPASVSLNNSREGKSLYADKFTKHSVRKMLLKISAPELIDVFQSSLATQKLGSECAVDLNNAFLLRLSQRDSELNFLSALYILRKENQIDDVSLKILKDAYDLKQTVVYEKNEEELFALEDSEKTSNLLKVITSFDNRFAKQGCFDESYRLFYSELLRQDKKLSTAQVEALYYRAFSEKRISESTYVALEQARLNELESSSLGLGDYLQKLRSLRIQYPLRDDKEKSDFVSSKVKKLHLSRRQKLFSQYSDIQIIMMGNVVKTLRKRLEYDAVTISGYKDGVLQEIIPLEPMERFRFAIRALRKEMNLLALNTFFNGHAPDYMDLMTASYEIGIIPASELETVSSLEDIWNPKKTFWEKASLWVKAFSSVATIVIPPPFGFVPALVLVAIEASMTQKKDPNTIDPTSMF